ncbi:hypothetical protein K402DRAFT_467917 [Aulographum hederae CBS 113979]|uniref:AB hydrolase-1 domain-containing protein n=1 Tax=Aulographum hederae CBS 113979 TaxID=1176131 RepID=A0A6G1GJB1_9PEZI|nr:hypothetical protein K402DRAFT_467917 [Aulographum hederae CBS 113979]
MPAPQVSFFTRGQRHPHGDSYIIINQCYVQYIPPSPSPPTSSSSPSLTIPSTHPPSPSTSPQPLPLLLLHGGGLTGALYESTPDLRPGWSHLFSHHRRPIYLLDTIDSC